MGTLPGRKKKEYRVVADQVRVWGWGILASFGVAVDYELWCGFYWNISRARKADAANVLTALSASGGSGPLSLAWFDAVCPVEVQAVPLQTETNLDRIHSKALSKKQTL